MKSSSAPATLESPSLQSKDTPSKSQRLHTLSLKVQNKPGVLGRITLVFSRRGFNIESLVVSHEKKKKTSRITITAYGEARDLEQVIKQLRKLINVIRAEEHFEYKTIEREMALIKIIANEENRSQILQIINHFKAMTADLTNKSVIIQAVGSTEKLNALVEMLNQFEIIEIIRTGKVIISRGHQET